MDEFTLIAITIVAVLVLTVGSVAGFFERERSSGIAQRERNTATRHQNDGAR